MLIDNNPDHQAVFSQALNDASPETICFTAPTGKDALYIMLEEELRPSYIFIELELPGMGGVEFLKAIKQEDALKDIPVIVHSTSPKPHLVIELKELGATALYFRPYDYYSICNMLTLYFMDTVIAIQPN
jgi:CheY-like chemotaxis protein